MSFLTPRISSISARAQVSATTGWSRTLALVLSVASLLAPTSVRSRYAPSDIVCDIIIEDFSTPSDDGFPAGFGTKHQHNDARARRDHVYQVIDGAAFGFAGKALKATYKDATITIARSFSDREKKLIAQNPLVSWRWRAEVLPQGADERNLTTNDSAASIYFLWQRAWPMRVKSLRYAWSSSAPLFAHHSRRLGYDQIIVAQTGVPESPGLQTQLVDLANHYNHYISSGAFVAPDGFAITTDADNTRSAAQALYADFRLCRPKW